MLHLLWESLHAGSNSPLLLAFTLPKPDSASKRRDVAPWDHLICGHSTGSPPRWLQMGFLPRNLCVLRGEEEVATWPIRRRGVGADLVTACEVRCPNTPCPSVARQVRIKRKLLQKLLKASPVRKRSSFQAGRIGWDAAAGSELPRRRSGCSGSKRRTKAAIDRSRVSGHRLPVRRARSAAAALRSYSARSRSARALNIEASDSRKTERFAVPASVNMCSRSVSVSIARLPRPCATAISTSATTSGRSVGIRQTPMYSAEFRHSELAPISGMI